MENMFALVLAHVALIINTMLLKEYSRELKGNLEECAWNLQLSLWGILLLMDIVKVAIHYF